jgi:hypothetical protein
MRKIFTLLSLIFVCAVTSFAQLTYTLSPTTATSASAAASPWTFSNSCSVTNANSKTYSTGSITTPVTFSGIKFSAGTQYTITFPSTISLKSISFYGYDNYSGKRSYFSEMNGVASTDTTINFLTAKTITDATTSPVTTVAVMSTVTYDYSSAPLSVSSFTFTPAGNQIVVTATITYSAITTGLDATTAADSNKSVDVYSIDGRRIRTNITRKLAVETLTPGVYVIDKKKVVVTRNTVEL